MSSTISNHGRTVRLIISSLVVMEIFIDTLCQGKVRVSVRVRVRARARARVRYGDIYRHIL